MLPKELTRAITALPAVRVGRRIDQAATLPQFVRDPACPVALIREFLAALFGADGHAPKLSRQNSSENSAVPTPPAYSQSAKPEHVQQLQEMMHGIVGLLVRCGVKARGARIGCFPTRRSLSTYARARDGIDRTEVRLQLTEGLSFVERVGFRYCVDKSLRASAAAVYWRTVDNINRQRLWMADQLETLHRQAHDVSFRLAREVASALIATETWFSRTTLCWKGTIGSSERRLQMRGLSNRCTERLAGFPSPAELFRQDMCAPLVRRVATAECGSSAETLPRREGSLQSC